MGRTKKNPVDFVGRPVWAEISFTALRQNFQAIRDYVNPASEKRKTPRKVLSIVKGNGYGHGGPEVSKALEKFGSDWFGVASAGEGIELRKAGVRKPILVLGGFWPGEEKHLIDHNLTPAIHRCEHLALFEARYLCDSDAIPSWEELGARYSMEQKTARTRAETVARHFRLVLRRMLRQQVVVPGSGRAAGAQVAEAAIDKEIEALLRFGS